MLSNFLPPLISHHFSFLNIEFLQIILGVLVSPKFPFPLQNGIWQHLNW